MEEARKKEIDRENRLLMQKMSKIMLTTGRIDNHNNSLPKR